MAKVGIVLSGCGVYDGSEIHEAVLTMLALDQAGASYQCLAPNTPQMHVVDHLKGQPVPGATRGVLAESARIARGKILALDQVQVKDYDAFAFPGGFGAAKNLCTFAFEGDQCTVQPDVARVIREAHAAGQPLAFICIAPVIAAKVLGQIAKVKLTVGNDQETAAAIASMGGIHQNCAVDQAVVDREHKIVSTPAYMLATSISQVYASVQSAVSELLKLVG